MVSFISCSIEGFDRFHTLVCYGFGLMIMFALDLLMIRKYFLSREAVYVMLGLFR